MKIIAIVQVVSKEQGIWSPHHGPQLGSPVPGRWTPSMLGFEGSGTYFWRSQRTVGDRDSPLKGTHSISQVQGHRTEAVIWKETGSDLLADLGEFSRVAGGHWNSHCRQRYWKLPFWELKAKWLVIQGNIPIHQQTDHLWPLSPQQPLGRVHPTGRPRT